MNPRYEKLKNLLKELFQLNEPDLDFGLYRIMRAKSAEVTKFLDEELLPQVQEAFSRYRSADKEETEQELHRAIEQATALGLDPEVTPKVRELREKLKATSDDGAALESEVYDHLYSFFRRYYAEGDFLSKRVYKPGVYAIPYEGEEVKLYWANYDQYYIKTSEYLREYSFRLNPSNEANPMRVHFRLVDATEGEHGNIKEQEGKKRRFKLAQAHPVVIEHGELVVRFTYEPQPEDQKELNAAAERTILSMTDPSLVPWLELLQKPHLRADGTVSDSTRLRVHLDRYTARNTFDYFIHKDLGTFLRRELDFYIKNEVMHLDDIEQESAPRVEQYLSKIKVIRSIAGKIIDFLAQLEDFQKKLWLKKKFVTETSWCIRIGIIPEEFYPEIVQASAQWDEWNTLHHFESDVFEAAAAGELFAEHHGPRSIEFLKAHPTLMIDTRHFSADFTERLLSALDEIDEQTDGVLVHSENFQALNLMQRKYRQKIKCVYIDPPYNTGNDGFLYKDNYQHSSWISMLNDRIELSLQYIKLDGAIFTSIDEVEQPNLRLLFDYLLGSEQFIADMVWAAGRKNDSRLISVSHEYIVSYVKNHDLLINQNTSWRQKKKGLNEIYAKYESLKQMYHDDYEKMTEELKNWFTALPNNHPAKAHKHYCNIDKKGIYFAADISWPGGGGPKYEVLHPKTGKPVKIPSGGWRFSKLEEMQRQIEEDRIHFGVDESQVPCRKSYLKEHEHQTPYSVFYQDGRAATKRLREIIGSDVFGYPKDEYIISDIISMVSADLTLDFFAGSGTTGHAVINLNREDGGRRKFILVEMADYFDTVLLPRLKKVTFTPEWKDGAPKRLATPEEAERSPRMFKIVRLESYEDTLNNLELKRSKEQEDILFSSEAQGPDGFKEQYLLHYMLDVESRGSQSLLNIEAFDDPMAYQLKVKRPGSDESSLATVDLIETFNWLLGLTVQHIAAPQVFHARFVRSSEGRLELEGGRLQQHAQGRWWFRIVEGITPDGRKTLVIWRNLTDSIEQDNLVLDTWFSTQGYSSKDSEFDLIYVNGTNNLENLRLPDATWKVRLIEEDFKRLMFEAEEGI
jgi:adenine-specific DNA-methyltransferase